MTRNESAAVREAVIESMERSAEVYGLSRSAGRVFGELYFAEEARSIPELVEATGYAKSTISTVTRKLTRIGLVHRRSSSGGGRRVRFEAETDFWFVVQDVLQQHVRRELTGTRRRLDEALEQLDGEAAGDRERIEELQATYDELGDLIELATRHSAEELVEAIEEYEG